MLGYKHTLNSIEKMKKRFLNPHNHPMYGRSHTLEAKSLISKPGAKNPMFGKKHSDSTKQAISLIMTIKKGVPVNLFDKDNNLISKFRSSVELSKYLGCHKSTVGEYLKSGKALAFLPDRV